MIVKTASTTRVRRVRTGPERGRKGGLSVPAFNDDGALPAAVLDAALDSIVTIDELGLITEFNAAAERTFGYQRAEVLGKPMVEVLVPEELRSAHKEGFRRYLDTGVAKMIGRRIEIDALRSDGTRFPIELAVAGRGSAPDRTRSSAPGPPGTTLHSTVAARTCRHRRGTCPPSRGPRRPAPVASLALWAPVDYRLGSPADKSLANTKTM